MCCPRKKSVTQFIGDMPLTETAAALTTIISNHTARENYDVGSMSSSCPGNWTEARLRSLAPLLRIRHVKATFYPVYCFFKPVLLHQICKHKPLCRVFWHELVVLVVAQDRKAIQTPLTALPECWTPLGGFTVPRLL